MGILPYSTANFQKLSLSERTIKFIMIHKTNNEPALDFLTRIIELEMSTTNNLQTAHSIQIICDVMYFPGEAQQILQQNQGKHILNSDIVSNTLQYPVLVDESYVRNEIFMSINFGNFNKFTKFKNLTIQIVVSAYKKDDSGYHLCKVII